MEKGSELADKAAVLAEAASEKAKDVGEEMFEKAKDVAAGAVLICATGALVTGLITFYPYLK